MIIQSKRIWVVNTWLAAQVEVEEGKIVNIYPYGEKDVDEGEIVGAREGKASLRDNMIRKINYKPFTADRLYEG